MLTKAELIEVMEMYVQPLYLVIGSAIAVVVMALAVYFVLHNFIRRV